MAAILVFQNKETTAMLVFQDLPIILWELNSSLMQTLSFVPINLHRCCNWPREGKCSIAGGRMWTRVKVYPRCLLLSHLSCDFRFISQAQKNQELHISGFPSIITKKNKIGTDFYFRPQLKIPISISISISFPEI